MTSSSGFNRNTGQPLTDWDHVVQSIAVILTTPIGTRVMRREFGSEIPALIDRPLTDRVVLAVYVACANALRQWEPRFRLRRCQLIEIEPAGKITLALSGEYRPKGHLGDEALANDNAELIVSVSRFTA